MEFEATKLNTFMEPLLPTHKVHDWPPTETEPTDEPMGWMFPNRPNLCIYISNHVFVAV